MRSLVLLLVMAWCQGRSLSTETVYEWTNLVFEGLPTGLSFNESNCALAGVKVFRGTYYVTVPRWLPGVPATLLRVNPATGGLVPFPSYEANAVETGWLTYVQSMEIDSRGWMWVRDVGRLNIFADPSTIENLQPKLVIYDLLQGCIVRTHVFPDSVFPRNNSFANDIVVDEARGLAYMSDTWAAGGLVVYDFASDRSRRWDHSAFAGDPEGLITENGVTYASATPSDGIALSPDGAFVYFCAMSTRFLYRAATELLADFSLPDEALKVELLGKKGISDGMAFARDGTLYFGSNELDAVVAWNASQPVSSAVPLFQDSVANQWVDTFAFDEDSLVWVSNRLLRFFHRNVSSTDANFRILRAPVGSPSYIESGNPQPPTAPCIA